MSISSPRCRRCQERPGLYWVEGERWPWWPLLVCGECVRESEYPPVPDGPQCQTRQVATQLGVIRILEGRD